MVTVHQFYRKDPTNFYVVLESLAGGELFDRIVKKVCAFCMFSVLFFVFFGGGSFWDHVDIHTYIHTYSEYIYVEVHTYIDRTEGQSRPPPAALSCLACKSCGECGRKGRWAGGPFGLFGLARRE